MWFMTTVDTWRTTPSTAPCGGRAEVGDLPAEVLADASGVPSARELPAPPFRRTGPGLGGRESRRATPSSGPCGGCRASAAGSWPAAGDRERGPVRPRGAVPGPGARDDPVGGRGLSVDHQADGGAPVRTRRWA